jgi:hypothetical protein
MKLCVLLASLLGVLGQASSGWAATVTITNTENEDLSVYVSDQNAQGTIVLPSTGGGCANVAAGDSVTFDATTDSNGNYSVVWTAEQPLQNPAIESGACAGDPSQPCQINMTSAAVGTPHCQGS